MIRTLVRSVILGTVIIPTIAPLANLLRTATELRPLTMGARRRRLMPDLYASVEKIRAEIPMSETIALVGVSRESLDQAVFVNYYLYPHPTRVFRDRWQYLAPPDKPKTLYRLGPTLRQTTYGDLRND